jgi:hypothetical protein
MARPAAPWRFSDATLISDEAAARLGLKVRIRKSRRGAG